MNVDQEELPEDFMLVASAALRNIYEYDVRPTVILLPMKWYYSYRHWCSVHNPEYLVYDKFQGVDVQFALSDSISVGFTL